MRSPPSMVVNGVAALYSWRASLVKTAPTPGQLGSTLTMLAVTLGPGGAASVLVAGLISWIRSRHGDFELIVERKYGKHSSVVKASAKRVRGLAASDLHQEIARI